MTLLLRSYTTGLQVRSDGDGRTLVGVAAPYGTPVTIHEGGRTYLETFVRGAFADDVADPAQIPLTARHPASDDVLPIGRTLALREEHDGLHGEWHVSDTEFGTEVLTLVRDGAITTGLSVGFTEHTDRWSTDRRTVQRVRAHLDHVALGQGARLPVGPHRRRTAPLTATPTGGPTQDEVTMPTYELPEHTTHKGDGTMVLAFTDPLTAADATLVHRHLQKIHPGASVVTTGDRQVTVTRRGPGRPKKT